MKLSSSSSSSLLQYVMSFTKQSGYYLENPSDALIKPNPRSIVYTTPSAPRSHLKRLRNEDSLPDVLVEQGDSKRAQGWRVTNRKGSGGFTHAGETVTAADGAGIISPFLSIKECILMVLRNVGKALSSKEITHPEIEALFTIDEETGMTGAMGLEGGVLKGEILLNLDTEEDDEIGIGCAGGVDVTATKNYKEETTPTNTTAFSITVKGLNGGHSGMDIIKGLGNANKIMNRVLYDGFEKYGLRIAEINGGSLRNAIPRESFASIVIDTVSKESFLSETEILINNIKNEFSTLESNLAIEIQEIESPKAIMELGVQESFIKAIYAAHNGVYRMSPDVVGLVETSNNIARIIVKDGSIKVGCLTRSSSETNKWDLANSLRSCFELAGLDVDFSGEYPGWLPNLNSEILVVLEGLYKELFKENPNVAACHAGLECGILGQNYPDMDMISFGPNIRGAHSPDERAQISSTQKFWKLLVEVLKNIPQKA